MCGELPFAILHRVLSAGFGGSATAPRAGCVALDRADCWTAPHPACAVPRATQAVGSREIKSCRLAERTRCFSFVAWAVRMITGCIEFISNSKIPCRTSRPDIRGSTRSRITNLWWGVASLPTRRRISPRGPSPGGLAVFRSLTDEGTCGYERTLDVLRALRRALGHVYALATDGDQLTKDGGLSLAP